MKLTKILLLAFVALCLVFSFALAADDSAAKGKAMFNDKTFAGGKKACSSCHPDGKGLEKSGAKKEWKTPVGAAKTLEEAINLCIVNANGGKALDPKSQQMADMVAYIKSLGAKKPEKKKPAGGY